MRLQSTFTRLHVFVGSEHDVGLEITRPVGVDHVINVCTCHLVIHLQKFIVLSKYPHCWPSVPPRREKRDVATSMSRSPNSALSTECLSFTIERWASSGLMGRSVRSRWISTLCCSRFPQREWKRT